MRIRKKLIFLHTVFSILLTSVLLIAVRPAVNQAVSEAEGAIASRAVRMLEAGENPDSIADLVAVRRGTVTDLNLPQGVVPRLAEAGGEPVRVPGASEMTWRGVLIEGAGEPEVLAVGARLESARRAAGWVYILIIGALVAVYALIAVSLEVFVLPRHVYGPIRLLIEADNAVQVLALPGLSV